MCRVRSCCTVVLAACVLSFTATVLAEDIIWDFENGNAHGFTLKCQVPATPAAQRPETAGDEALTGVGGPKGLPGAGIAWAVSDLDEFVGLIPAVAEGDNIVNGRIVYQSALPKAAGPSRLGQSGYLNTYAFNCWGDNLHTAENDQIAGSPLIELGEGAVLMAWALGGQGVSAPTFDPDASKGYATNCGGIAILNASGNIVESIAMPSTNWGEYTLDLSGLAGQRVYVEIVDAFAGAWGWMAVDQVKITNAKVVGTSARPFAVAPDPVDGATGVAMPLLRWRAGEGAALHRVYFGTSPELGPANLVSPGQPATLYYYGPGLQPGVTYYWRVDEVEKNGTVHEGSVWSFTAAPLTAYDPAPVDTACYVDPAALTLQWKAGKSAMSHDVYFGTNEQDIAAGTAGTFKGNQMLLTFESGVLQFETTYYWRIDEVAPGGKVTGAVWRFTTAPAGMGGVKRELWENITGTSLDALRSDSRFPGAPSDVNEVPDFESPTFAPDKNNYGGRLQAWLHVPVAGDYTFWIASDDNGELYLGEDPDSAVRIASVASWTAARAWDAVPGQKSKAIHLETGRYYLGALWKEGEGGDHCSVAWKGAGIPERTLITGNYLKPFVALWAYGPRPANGVVNTRQSLELRWTAGVKAAQHEVYFGDDKDAVASATPASSGIYRGRQALDQTTFQPGNLEWNKTYYWRVDEINVTEADSPWQGAVWSFTTAGFIVVDDFEEYTDEENQGTRIYETWIDGYSDGSSGSTVGNLNPPFAEQTIVHDGHQAMPMDYNNINAPYFSQAYREFSPLMNWTVNGVTDLSLWVRGVQAPVAPVAEVGGKLSVTGEGADIWGTADQFTFVYKTLSGNGSLEARVTSIGTGSSRWAKGGVMIRDSLEAGSASAQMILTGGDGNGAAFQNRASTDLDMGANDSTSSSTAAAAIAPPYWVKIERTGDSLAGYLSADGKTWTQQGSAQYIAMTAPAYIGLCVTSHTAGEYRTFTFDNIKATGAGGAWQTKEVGLARNSPQPLYLVVEDSAGKTATVVDPNAAAVNAAAWTEWKVPLTDLAGVNLTKVKKLYLGVGDKANLATDGTGRIYVDDIRVIKPN